MIDPSYLQLSRARHQELIQAATTGHFKTERALATRPKRVLLNLSHLLIGAGRKLKTQAQLNSPIPAFRVKQ